MGRVEELLLEFQRAEAEPPPQNERLIEQLRQHHSPEKNRLLDDHEKLALTADELVHLLLGLDITSQ